MPITKYPAPFAYWIIRGVTCLGFLSSAHFCYAEYLFLTGDPRLAEEQLISDMQRGEIDLTNVSATAQDTLRRLSNNTMSFSFLEGLGKLISVCPTLVVTFPNGSELAFRAVHEHGSMDWIVTVSREPEMVQNISVMKSKSGPPAILPLLPPGGDKELLPSVELDCRPVGTTAPSEDELREACQKWPDMCLRSGQQ